MNVKTCNASQRDVDFDFDFGLALVPAPFSPLSRRVRLTQVTPNKASGFSLIELLVVVSILVAVSSISAIMISAKVLDDKYVDLAKVEMSEIAKAVKQFQMDTGYYPGQGPFRLLSRTTAGEHSCATACANTGSCLSRGAVDPSLIREYAETVNVADRTTDLWHRSPVNMLQLIQRPVLCDNHPLAYLSEWDQSASRGWRGPYLAKEAYVDISCSLSADNAEDSGVNGELNTGPGVQNCAFEGSNVLGNLFNIAAIADPFISSNDKAVARGGVLDWRSKVVVSTDTTISEFELGRIGQPYLLFFTRQFLDSDGNEVINKGMSNGYVARLVSAGPDKVYGGVNAFINAPSLTDYPSQEDWCMANVVNGFNTSDTSGADDIVLCF